MHRPKDIAYKDIMNIKSSANRAAELVRKLLALARQQTLQNEVVNLGDVLTDEFPLFKRYLGEKSELKISTAPDLWYVMTDKHEFMQALFNLITNAKDAMPDGGTLTIAARNVPERESQKLGHREFAPGEYVLIEVGDTGARHEPGGDGQDLRAVLHDEGHRQGHRPGARLRLRHGEAVGRLHLPRERGRQGHHLPHLSAAPSRREGRRGWRRPRRRRRRRAPPTSPERAACCSSRTRRSCATSPRAR